MLPSSSDIEEGDNNIDSRLPGMTEEKNIDDYQTRHQSSYKINPDFKKFSVNTDLKPLQTTVFEEHSIWNGEEAKGMISNAALMQKSLASHDISNQAEIAMLTGAAYNGSEPMVDNKTLDSIGASGDGNVFSKRTEERIRQLVPLHDLPDHSQVSVKHLQETQHKLPVQSSRRNEDQLKEQQVNNQLKSMRFLGNENTDLHMTSLMNGGQIPDVIATWPKRGIASQSAVDRSSTCSFDSGMIISKNCIVFNN
jgi:hypothetical protein